jgi:hypothetical protein
MTTATASAGPHGSSRLAHCRRTLPPPAPPSSRLPSAPPPEVMRMRVPRWSSHVPRSSSPSSPSLWASASTPLTLWAPTTCSRTVTSRSMMDAARIKAASCGSTCCRTSESHRPSREAFLSSLAYIYLGISSPVNLGSGTCCCCRVLLQSMCFAPKNPNCSFVTHTPTRTKYTIFESESGLTLIFGPRPRPPALWFLQKHGFALYDRKQKEIVLYRMVAAACELQLRVTARIRAPTHYPRLPAISETSTPIY